MSKIVTFIQYHLKQGSTERKEGEIVRQKMRIWASEESDSRILMGRVSQHLEKTALWAAIHRESEDPASLSVKVQGRAQRLEQERDVRGVREAPWGSRAQMLDFCFLDILLSTCEGPCVYGHMGILLVFGDQSKKKTVSWTP